MKFLLTSFPFSPNGSKIAETHESVGKCKKIAEKDNGCKLDFSFHVGRYKAQGIRASYFITCTE